MHTCGLQQSWTDRERERDLMNLRGYLHYKVCAGLSEAGVVERLKHLIQA